MMFVLIGFVWVALGILLAVRWSDNSVVSRYELMRRSSAGDQSARERMLHHKREPELNVLRQMAITLLSSAIVTVSVLAFGRWPGIIIGTLLLIAAPLLVRLPLLVRTADRLQGVIYPRAAAAADRAFGFLHLFRGRDIARHRPRVYSKEELVDLIHNSRGILSKSEEQRLLAGLSFDEQKITEVMTPASQIITADANDTLGPLVMHDLHSSGHDCFPVIDGDLDHIVGILDLRQHTDMKTAPSTVRAAMEANVETIYEDETLEYALRLFAERHKLLIAVDRSGATKGVVGLGDVLETLLGTKVDASLADS